MKMQKFARVLFSLTFLFSCSDESLPEAELTLNLQKISNRIGTEEAINYVEEVGGFLDEISPSTSGYSRAVNSVSALVFSDVKASAMKPSKYKDLGISDTLAYVFNFGDSSGYVIVSNDKRVENPLFVFVEKGRLINGKTDNPGLALFLERLEDYVMESIAKSDAAERKVMMVAQKGPVNNPFLNLKHVVGPLVPVEWGQEEPFWLKLNAPQCYNGYYLTGCSATAVAQIMSSFKYPTSLGGMTYEWNFLNSYKKWNSFYSSGNTSNDLLAREMVSDLFKRIGEKGTGIGTDYTCGENGATMRNTLEFLKKNGFSRTSSLTSYTTAYFEHIMDALQPTIATGCNNGDISQCHTWVIDGLAYVYVPIPVIPPIIEYYVHNNWGWDGDDNGYYFSDVLNPHFDTNRGDYKRLEISSVSR
jgi:hypothetical protein